MDIVTNPVQRRVKGGQGYLVIDDRASGGKKNEWATLTCCHCGSIVALNPERKRKRGYCRKHHAYVCDLPVCQTNCTDIMKCLELLIKYPGLPTLPRGYDGSILFDRKYLEEGKLF